MTQPTSQEVKHTPLHLDGIVGDGHEAMLSGEHVRVYVDCRENFGDPMPLAKLFAAAPDMLSALKAIIDSATDGRDCPEWLQERIVDAQAALKKAGQQ